MEFNKVKWCLEHFHDLVMQKHLAIKNDDAEYAKRVLFDIELAITLLPDDEREVIEALYKTKLKWTDASSKLFISENALSKRRKKAIQRICNALNGCVVIEEVGA